jgi:hypothetical protein
MMLFWYKYECFAILYKPTIQVRQLQQPRHVLRLHGQTRSAYPIRRRRLCRSIDIDWDMADIVCTATSVMAKPCALCSPPSHSLAKTSDVVDVRRVEPRPHRVPRVRVAAGEPKHVGMVRFVALLQTCSLFVRDII